MAFRLIFLLLPILVLSSAGLPEKGPLPTKKPAEAEATQPPPKTDNAVKSPPDEKKQQPEDRQPEQKPEAKPRAELKLTIEPENDKDHIACLAALKEIGAVFRKEKRIDDGKGCGIDRPLVLQSVLPGITLKPEGVMRCETALELARWTKEAVLPAARTALDSEGPLTSVNQASSYVCRLRNNAAAGKISEHARGNAIDIASFTFRSGKTLEIQPRDEDSTLAGAFQRAVTATGCLYFETVLDPGSDEAHENHLHFDVLERKNGYRYCR